jgi:hypothetical protein
VQEAMHKARVDAQPYQVEGYRVKAGALLE